MEIEQQYIESLLCAIVELEPNFEKKKKLYQNLCNAINREAFNIPFNDFIRNNYKLLIREYNICYEKSKDNQYGVRDFDIIESIGEGGFGKVFKGKSKIDKQVYAIKRTLPKSKK